MPDITLSDKFIECKIVTNTSEKLATRPTNVHQNLDERFYRLVSAASFPAHKLRYRNDGAAESIGLNHLGEAEWLSHFGRFVPFTGSFETPLALCYHGHQFGHYNPDLGDGRGFLFAQFYDSAGRLMD